MRRQRRGNRAGSSAPSRRIATAAGAHLSTPADPATPAALAWRSVLTLAGLILVLGAIGLVPLMLWRSPTRIAADLVVKRLVFATGHDTPQVAITDQSTGFEALT